MGQFIKNRKRLELESRKLHVSPKVTKMGSIIGHRIDYNGVGALRGQQHIPSKSLPKHPPPLRGGRFEPLRYMNKNLLTLVSQSVLSKKQQQQQQQQTKMGKVIFSDDIYICTASMPHGAIDKTGTWNNPEVPELCYKNRETVFVLLGYLKQLKGNCKVDKILFLATRRHWTKVTPL